MDLVDAALETRLGQLQHTVAVEQLQLEHTSPRPPGSPALLVNQVR